MALTVIEVLALQPFTAAAPEVLTARHALDRPVRWVHSSEIYEMGPLLSSGELLLTTGLGLAGADAGARRHYIREIAERNLSALALEVGRTFETVPAELVDEAAKQSLPLIVLHRVVPFIRMTEAANTAIINGNFRRLELTGDLSRDLDHALIAGDGIRNLLAIAGQAMGAALLILAENGIVVSAYGVDDDHAARRLAADPVASVPLVIRGQAWGRLCVGQASSLNREEVGALLERTAIALTLSLLGTGMPPGDPERQAAALLEDLIAGGTIATTDFRLRASLAGFHPPHDCSLVGVAVDAGQAGAGLALLGRAAESLDGPALSARVRGGVLGVLTVSAGSPEPVSAVHRALTEALQTRSEDESCTTVGPAVRADSPPAEIARSLIDARDAVVLARSTPSFREWPAVVTTLSVAMELQISRLADQVSLQQIIHEMLGPLIRWDQRHHTGLVNTLEVHLRHGCSPTRTAAALYLGRHSVYQRLERIESLLGISVDDPDLHSGLLLAACAARVRGRRARESMA